jgi:hypothetical protein
MAEFIKFECFVNELGLGVHNLNTDTLKIYLSNATPDPETDAVKADLTEITNEYGYAPADVTNTWSQTGGVATLAGTSVTWTGDGGSFGPFRYAVLYNDTAADKNLIGYWDYGSAISINNGGEFTVTITNLATLR